MNNDLNVWSRGFHNPNIYTTYLNYNNYLYGLGGVLSFLVRTFTDVDITVHNFTSFLKVIYTYGKITRESQVVGDICTMIAYSVFDVRC